MFLHVDFIKAIIFSLALGLVFSIASVASSVYAVEEEVAEKLEQNAKEVSAKEQEIAALEAEIKQLQGHREGAANEAAIISSQLNRLRQQLEKAKLELNRTELNIKSIEEEKRKFEKEIGELQMSMEESRQKLRSLIRLLYEREQESIIQIFFTSWSLSTVLAEQAAYKELQDRTIELIRSLRQNEEKLVAKQEELEARQEDLGRLQTLLDRQQNELAARNREQQTFLNAKKEEQLQFENLIAEARQARDEIKREIFTLRNSNIEMSLTDAIGMAKHAGSLTGVRPAVLLGVLKVESNMGNNLGSGKFPDDMQPGSRQAFLRITAKLGLDPYNTPISARQNCGASTCWGGAMGPAQFMPATWEGIEQRVAGLMGKPQVNPYEMLDGMVAMAVYLADRGASDPAREYEAINRYFAGANWRRFTWYGDRVMAVAKEYENRL